MGGQGSSLDQRDYGIYNNEPRYANPPGPYSMDAHLNGQQRQNGHHKQNGLDLTNNREYRGSAFELYKKPLSFHHHHQPLTQQPQPSLGASVTSPSSMSSSNSRYHNTNSVW